MNNIYIRREGRGASKNDLEHTYFFNDPLPKAVGFTYFHETPLKMMNVFSKVYDVTKTKNYNKHTARYLKK